MTDEIRVIDDVFPPVLFERLARFLRRVEEDHVVRSDSRTGRRDPWRRLAARLSQRVPLVSGARTGWRGSLVATDPHNLADVSVLMVTAPTLGPLQEAWTVLSEIDGLKDGVAIGCDYRSEREIQASPPAPGGRVVEVCMNDRWSSDWAGETVFLSGASEIVRSVAPKPNRAILFPADARRRRQDVSRKSRQPLRMLSYQTRGKGSRDFEDLSRFLSLNGAMACPHYVGTLHDHLLRTFQALEGRGCAREVCLGGGLHAIYGTSLLDHRMLGRSDRALVKAQFGDAAENLAYLFSILDRPRTLAQPLALDETALVEPRGQAPLRLSRGEFEALRWMECANLADQDGLNDYPSLRALWNSARD